MEMSEPQLAKISRRKTGRKGAKAQSLVEFAITLPILILLFTGMIEFGFMLNTYLSVQDAVRSTARRFSTINPYLNDTDIDPAFYSSAAEYAIDLLAPAGDPDSRQIIMEAGRDNILVSLIAVEVDESTDPDSVSGINRFDVGGDYYKHFDETDPPSTYTDDAIADFALAIWPPTRGAGGKKQRNHYCQKAGQDIPEHEFSPFTSLKGRECHFSY